MGCSSSRESNVYKEYNVPRQPPRERQRNESMIVLHSILHSKAAESKAAEASKRDVIDAGTSRMGVSARKIPTRRNVYAPPLVMDADFVAPFHPKTRTEEDFILGSLRGNFVFNNLNRQELRTLLHAFEKYEVKAGTVIIKQGDIGDYFYIVQSGSVRASVNESGAVATINPGQSFGELALLYDCPRNATCLAPEPCQLWRVDQGTFRRVLASSTMQSENEIKEILRNVPFLANLDETFLSRITDALTPVTFKKDELIVKKGESGKVFYIIEAGRVKVTEIEVGVTKYGDQTLGPGEYFGEMAIVKNEKRTANVTAIEETSVLCLPGEVFANVLGDLSDLVMKTNDKRKLKAMPIFHRARIEEHEMNAVASSVVDMSVLKGHVFFTEGQEVPEPAMFLIHSGKVSVESSTGEKKFFGGDEYFGDDTVNVDRNEPTAAPYTIIAEERTTLGVLTMTAIESSLGRGRLSMRNLRASVRDKLDQSITMDELNKKKLIGIGGFGQVWLVSRKGRQGVYALKIQTKRNLVKHNQVDGLMREKQIMASLDHPFITKLVNVFQDPTYVYMVLQFVQGGELYSIVHGDNKCGISEQHAMFYAANIYEALSYMHQRDIVYRDLKLENVLINEDGYCVIADFGFAKIVKGKTYTFCGTPLYLAPEIILNRGHNKAADHWSWGVLIYEMMAGETPFETDDRDEIQMFKRITQGTFSFPPGNCMSDVAKDIIRRLLVVHPTDRLGNLAHGGNDVKDHAWFDPIDFQSLVKMGIEAPWKPKIKNFSDTSNFENFGSEQPSGGMPLGARHQKLFKDF